MVARYKFLLLLLAISLVRGLIYSAVVPPWQAPDEPRHFEYVKLLYEKRRLVGWGDVIPSVEQEIIASMDTYSFWRFGVVHSKVFPAEGLPRNFREIWVPALSHELHQPPLAYIVYATVLPFAGPDPATQLYLMRLISVIMGALIVLVAYLTAVEVFPDDPFMFLGVPTMIAFLPMHTYTTGMLTNDNLAALLVLLIILLQVISLRWGFTGRRLAVSVILVVLALLTKRTAIVGPPIVLVALVSFLARSGVRSRVSWARVAVFSGTLFFLAGILALRWETLRGILSRMVPGLGQELNSLLYIYVLHFLRPLPAFRYSIDLSKYLSSEALEYYQRFFQMLFETFWARFGWVNVRLDPFWYLLIGLVCVVSAGGLVVFVLRCLRRGPGLSRFQNEVLFLFFTAILLNLGVIAVRMIRDWDNVPRPLTQGKFLFPVIIPIATLFVLGLRELLPLQRRWVLLLGWCGALVLVDVVGLMFRIVPFYYG